MPADAAPPAPAPLAGADAEPLRREISRLGIAILAINGVVGAGIFKLPAGAAQLTGAFSPLVFLICGLLMSTLMASFALAASWFRGTGGPIVYAREAFGPFAGFQTGWLLYVGRVTALAANGNLLASYLGTFVPGAGEGLGRVLVIAALSVGFGAVNVLGVRQGMASIAAITIAKFVPLLLFVLIGLTHLRVAPFADAALPVDGKLGAAVLLVFYAFIGFEGALVPAGESRDPQRDMPRAMIGTAVFATGLYVAIQAICVCVVPQLGDSQRPLADAAAAMVGPVGASVIAVGAILSVLGNHASSVLSAPRMTWAMARDGALPAAFGAVHATRRTPHVSIVAYCALGFALGASGSFTGLAVMSSFARLLVYLTTLGTLPFLRRRHARDPQAFRLPGGLTIPAVAGAICVWLVAQVSWEAVWKTALLVAGGAALYGAARPARGR